MLLISGSLLWDMLLSAVFFSFLLYWYVTNNDDYWDKRGVSNVRRGILLGSLFGKKSQSDSVLELYNKFAGEKYAGYFQSSRPILMVRDPDLIRSILVKDFTYFQDRENIAIGNDPLSKNLFNLRGHIWRSMRYKLTPTFTTGKLRAMFLQVSDCADHMTERIEREARDEVEVDLKEFMKVFTIEVIASCAFGLEIKPGTPQFDEFTRNFSNALRGTFATFLRFAGILFFPRLANIIAFTFPSDATNYFVNLIKATVKNREDKSYRRNDYLQLLLSLKEQEESGQNMLSVKHLMADTSEDDSVIIEQMRFDKPLDQLAASTDKLFTEDAVCANSFIFLIAGSESVASAICFALFDLCRFPDVQTRLQREVDEVLEAHDNVWSYPTVKDMTYLDQVLQESQRLHPVLPLLARECVKTYKVPGSDLVIEKGTLVTIPAAGLHLDPLHYSHPQDFDPSRFEGNNFKPSPTFLPFGDGPRICIAMRFAVMEVKTCLAHVVSKYSVKLSPKTIPPYELDPRSFTPALKTGMWLTFQRRIKPSESVG